MEVTFRNPLKVSLALSNLSLFWNFSPDDAPPTSEEPATEEGTVTNEDELTPGVGRRRRAIWKAHRGFDRLASVLVFQTPKKVDVITTEVIQEFHIGPDETKMVQWL